MMFFQYKIEGDEQFYHTKIPKFIIQPFCENCFKHSFKKIELVENPDSSLRKGWKVDFRNS